MCVVVDKENKVPKSTRVTWLLLTECEGRVGRGGKVKYIEAANSTVREKAVPSINGGRARLAARCGHRCNFSTCRAVGQVDLTAAIVKIELRREGAQR